MEVFFRENKKNSDAPSERIALASDALVHISETDAPIVAFKGSSTGEVSADVVAKYAGLDKELPVEERTVAQFFDNLTTDRDWYGEKEKKIAKRFAELRRVLEEDLRDLRVFRFGRIQIEIFVVGIDTDGNLAGVRTNAVET